MHDIAQKVIENPDIISKYLTPENESTISTNFEKHTLKYFIEMPALPSVDNSDSIVQSYNDLTTADSSASGLSRKSFKTNEEVFYSFLESDSDCSIRIWVFLVKIKWLVNIYVNFIKKWFKLRKKNSDE